MRSSSWAYLALLAAAAMVSRADVVRLTAGDTKVSIDSRPLRLTIEQKSAPPIESLPGGGLLLGDADKPEAAHIVSRQSGTNGDDVFQLETPSGRKARLSVRATPHQIDFDVLPSEAMAVLLSFKPAQPGFGLSDHAVVGRKSFDTDVTGYRNDRFLSGQGLSRLVSNFAIYPKHKFAFLVWEPGVKVVRSTAEEITQGARRTDAMVRFSVFLGDPHEIYQAFLFSRNLRGYPVMKPKYEFFGVGWEAFGALAWDTNHRTVKENVDRYLADGYPLAWMVVGSGFWR